METTMNATATLEKQAVKENIAAAKADARDLNTAAKAVVDTEAQMAQAKAQATQAQVKAQLNNDKAAVNDKYAAEKEKVREVLNNVTEKVIENGAKAGDFIAQKANSLLGKFKK